MHIPSLLATMILLWMTTKATVAETLHLYLDADFSLSAASAEAIELGVNTALKEVNHTIDGTTIEIIRKDSRGNVKRSKNTMDTYLSSDTALAIIGGLHSPPYLTYKEFINENNILTLLPWSAAGPITRTEANENWLFRLSVDDSKSGDFFIREAVERGKCSRISLALLDTGWGRANAVSLTKALNDRGMEPTALRFFSSSITASTAKALALDLSKMKTDCLVILANWTNGAVLINAIADHSPSVRVYSHWGITGGEFADYVPHKKRQLVQLSVLQTCALAREASGSKTISQALRLAGYPGASVATLKAPTGFVHGYDLTRILIAAIRQVKASGSWTDDIKVNRALLKHALENLHAPVEGILDTYDPPFFPYSADSTDGHEALGLNDLCLARFREDGLLEHAG